MQICSDYVELIHKLTNFVRMYGLPIHKETSREWVYNVIKLHFEYNTLAFILSFGVPIAVARWNVIDEEVLHICDLVINPQYKNKLGIFRDLAEQAILQFPQAKYICYEREYKKNNRMRKYKISKLIRSCIYG